MSATRLAVVAVALGVLSVPTPAQAAAAAAPAPSLPSVVDPDTAGRRVLTDDAIRPAARAGLAARIRKWPGKRIPYYESIPAKWDWSLDQALAHWNRAGGKIKFVEVPRRKAKLVIGYGDTGGADGVGTLGYQSRNYINLSPAYKKANEFEPETRVWVGRLFTHELGHVLGYNHTAGRCSLMYPVYDFGVCETLPYDKPGYYNCRWIDKKLLKRFTKMYGGRPKRPPVTCPIEALPGQLSGVTFTGGNAQGGPVRVTWVPPASVRDGTKVFVTVWKGASCTTHPDTFERRVALDPKVRSWTDPAFGQGTWCYAVHIENRYGATQPLFGKALARFAPVPAAPALAAPTWRPQDGGWRFTWTPPLPGTHLVVMRDYADPGSCVSTYDEFDADYLDQVTATTWLLPAYAPAECLNLFVVTDWDTVSPATRVDVTVPSSPAAPVVSTPTWNASLYGSTFSWTPPDDYTSLHAMRSFDDPDTCPATYDPDAAEWVDQQSPTTWLLSAYDASECVSLFAVTSWGTHSGRTQVVTQVPAPTATPVVGSFSPWASDPGNAVAVTVTLTPGDSYSLRFEVLQGACPAVAPADAGWFDGFEDTPNRYVFYPEPYGNTGTQCVLFAAVDYFGQPGPLVKKTFTVPGA